MHRRQTSCTNRTFNSLQFGVFHGIFERTVDFLRFFCETKVVWTCIHAYGSEWVKELCGIDYIFLSWLDLQMLVLQLFHKATFPCDLL